MLNANATRAPLRPLPGAKCLISVFPKLFIYSKFMKKAKPNMKQSYHYCLVLQNFQNWLSSRLLSVGKARPSRAESPKLSLDGTACYPYSTFGSAPGVEGVWIYITLRRHLPIFILPFIAKFILGKNVWALTVSWLLADWRGSRGSASLQNCGSREGSRGEKRQNDCRLFSKNCPNSLRFFQGNVGIYSMVGILKLQRVCYENFYINWKLSARRTSVSYLCVKR